MRIFCILLFLSFIHLAKIYSQGPVWSKVQQSKFDARTDCIEVDPYGNYWVAGIFSDTLVLDSTNSQYGMLQPSGLFLTYDIYLAKYNPSGQLIWSGQIISYDDDWISDIIVDDSGNVYVYGTFSFAADFDFSSGIYNLISNGSTDMFLAKYDNNANLKWAISFGNHRTEYANDLHMDNNGDLLVIGDMSDTVDFDPGPSTSYLYGHGFFDIFLAKYSNNGQFIWALNIGGGSFDYGRTVTVDRNNDIYITGEFSDTIYSDSNFQASYISSHPQTTDIFFAKYSSAGVYQWSNHLGNQYYEYAEGIVTDSRNNLYIAGTFYDFFDFNPSSSTNTLYASIPNMYLAKYNTNGQYLWAKAFTGDYSEVLTLGNDGLGNLLLSGFYSGITDMDPSTNILRDTANWADPVSILMSQEGNYLTHATISNPGNEGAWDAVVNSSGQVVMCGRYDSVFVVSTGDTTLNVKNPFFEFEDGFISIVPMPCFSNHDTIEHRICYGDSILIKGIYRKSAASVIDTANTVGSCHYVITNLVIVDSVYNATNQEDICSGDSLFIGGAYRKTPGNYTDYYTGIMGCDSTVITQLTVKNTPPTLYITTSICQGETYNAGGQSFSSTGLYLIMLTADNGCDSTIDIDLTVKELDESIIQSGPVLTAVEIGATYQWYDCDLKSIISGENGKSFTASINGNYAVIITKDNCTDSSACKTVTGLGIARRDLSNFISLQPNPNSGIFKIMLPQSNAVFFIKITDLSGREYYNAAHSEEWADIEISIRNGIYLVEVSSSSGEKAFLKMVVE